MTNEEEKILEEILDEENDITLEEAAEEAEDLQEETQDEVKEVGEEIPDDVRLDPDEIRERPVLRGGLRGAADPNMIQKHIDNFLAMLCGETPVDSNVRTSAEYWLKRLATGEGGSTKKIYCHPIRIYKTSGTNQYLLSCFVFNNDPTPLTLSTFKAFIDTVAETAGANVTFLTTGYYWTDSNRITSATYIFKSGTATYGVQGGNYNSQQFASVSGTWAEIFGDSLFDDGVNAIN